MMLKSPHHDPQCSLEGALQGCAQLCAVTGLIHQLAESLGKAIDAKDSHTLAHSEEVAVIAQSLALGMGLDRRLADLIHVAGHLHDIGKIGVPDHVLVKPGPLTAEQWRIMRTHPGLGADILAPLDCLRETGVADMVRAHHERFDGKGYPHGLSGGRIPLGARVIAVADALSAMLQARPYRPALPFERAAGEILRGAGRHFDPRVVEAFADTKDSLREMVAVYRCGSIE